MANDFMRNANKVSLDGEVVSFSNTLPIVDVNEDVVETPIVEEPKKHSRKAKKEEKVEETKDAEITESAEETTDEEKADEE